MVPTQIPKGLNAVPFWVICTINPKQKTSNTKNELGIHAVSESLPFWLVAVFRLELRTMSLQ